LTQFEHSRDVVIGSGPNGLAAAILLARAGRKVTVYEANPTIGGGATSAELTLPGFIHDVCSAIHPMAVASPCFESMPLADHGLHWVHPAAPLAHAMDDGTAVMLENSLRDTAAGLGPDGAAWVHLMQPLVNAWPKLRADVLGMPRFPHKPFAMAAFGLHAIRSGRSLAFKLFQGERARALFGGIAAHSIQPLESAGTAAIALVLGVCAHTSGWPMPRGGSQRISDALASYFRQLGGHIVTGHRVGELPPSALTMCDIGPRQLLAIAGDRLTPNYRRALESYQYGPGVFKMDWALDSPIPWRASECLRAGTVHVGGTFDEIAQWERSYTGSPFLLVVQQSLFDSTRAPHGKHTAWAYCHVPNGSTADYTRQIEDQMERFAPGFRKRILARHTMAPADLQRRNENYTGGDVVGGSNQLSQLLARPTLRLYGTSLSNVYLCSASTPPGGGVHGMCGHNAVKAALKSLAP